MSLKRCDWVGGDPSYIKYHDEEWGVPIHDDRKHFEFLILEGAQAGLSWLTILKRRDGYRRLFAEYDPTIVASFTNEDVTRLMQDSGIIRNRLKIKSAINNARVFLQIQEEFGSFDSYIWDFVDGKVVRHKILSSADYLATNQLSDTVSADLKKRGMSFVGSTIIYAHLQATGVINDHMVGCFKSQRNFAP